MKMYYCFDDEFDYELDEEYFLPWPYNSKFPKLYIRNFKWKDPK